MRYSRQGDPEFRHTSINVRTDVHDLIMQFKQDKRLRNKSVAMEELIIKGLKAEGYNLK